jgi:dihydroorotate dehydrogenase
MGAGGLSGPPLTRRSSDVVRRLRSRVGHDLCIIAVGGIETAQDVRDRLADGATLVQGYTAFLYVGPFWAARITRGLSRGL